MELFPYILMTTMTMFPSTNFIIKNINWIEYARKFSFDAMAMPYILGLVIALTGLKKKNFLRKKLRFSIHIPMKTFFKSDITVIALKVF